MTWLRRHPGWTCLFSLVLGLLILEGGTRWLLFGGSAAGARMRQPALFADHIGDGDYWKLTQRWQGLPGPVPAHLRHPELGWVAERMDARTLRLKRPPALEGRRPILLYGSSFAGCNTSEEDCYQGLLERSELRAEYVLVNYGVRGYGLDQALMLLRRTLPLFAEERPIVVFGVQVDEDFDRCLLELRGWPKPRLVLEQGVLREPAHPVPALDEYLRDHPLRFRSWAWSGLLFGTALLPAPLRRWCSGIDARAGEVQVMGRAVLSAARDEAQALGLDFFVLLLHGERYASIAENRNWRETFVHSVLDELRIPFVSSKRALREDALWNARALASYYGQEGTLAAHPTPFGNEVILRALVEGLRGTFEPWGEFAPIALANMQASALPDGRPAAVFEAGRDERYRGPAELERIVVEFGGSAGGARASSSLHWDLRGLAHEFQGALRHAPGQRSGAPVQVSARSGDRELARAVLAPEADELLLRLDLRGLPELTVELSTELVETRVYFARPSFR